MGQKSVSTTSNFLGIRAMKIAFRLFSNITCTWKFRNTTITSVFSILQQAWKKAIAKSFSYGALLPSKLFITPETSSLEGLSNHSAFSFWYPWKLHSIQQGSLKATLGTQALVELCNTIMNAKSEFNFPSTNIGNGAIPSVWVGYSMKKISCFHPPPFTIELLTFVCNLSPPVEWCFHPSLIPFL